MIAALPVTDMKTAELSCGNRNVAWLRPRRYGCALCKQG